MKIPRDIINCSLASAWIAGRITYKEYHTANFEDRP